MTPARTHSINNQASTPSRLDRLRAEIDTALSDHLHRPSLDLSPRLLAAMRYSSLNGGKRLRALLCCATSRALTGDHKPALNAACALEMLHSYSLIHDDLPAMDDDTLRRGVPTCHIKFDEAEAILAGDALQAEAFHLLTQQPIAATTIVAMINSLAQAAGAAGMVGGQSLDMAVAGTTQGELEQLHGAKTGALLSTSILLGAQIAGANPTTTELLHSAGSKLGLAFQVIDDVLDVTAQTTELGKDAGSDAVQGKLTFVNLLGIEGARDYSSELALSAEDALDRALRAHTDDTGLAFPDDVALLQEVTRALVDRRF